MLVEMGEARCRALTHMGDAVLNKSHSYVEMGEARCRALTQYEKLLFARLYRL